MKQYRKKPPRFTQDAAYYFLTFCTFKRKPLLHLSGIPEFLITELYFYESKIKRFLAYTIMPDHIHLLVEVDNATDLSIFLRDFKKFTSREIKTRLRSSGSPDPQPTRIQNEPLTSTNDVSPIHTNNAALAPIHAALVSGYYGSFDFSEPVWQPGTMDHCIRMNWTNLDYRNHLSYLFYNSMKHLNIPPKNFPYHNFSTFVQEGIFDDDYCSFDEQTFPASSTYEI
ncbi:MAG: transposase [Ignavibacteriae bacterium]|nr:transposase [Ignavibacteriota bacterium]